MRADPESSTPMPQTDDERDLMRDCAKLAFAEILRHPGANAEFSPEAVAKAAFACARAMLNEYRAVLRQDEAAP